MARTHAPSLWRQLGPGEVQLAAHLLVWRNAVARAYRDADQRVSWATTDEDVERSVAAMIRIARQEGHTRV